MHEGVGLVHPITRLILQLAIILITAKTFGYMVSRFLRQPSVLGELAAGMLIGPFALGSIPLGFLGSEPLFLIPPNSPLPITPELYGFAIVAAIVLLFLSGLETDLKTFLRFAGVGSLVGLGGVAATFSLGLLAAHMFLPDLVSVMDPRALFLGLIATATSVSITARILSEKRKLSSPEGVTILSAAVLDDVLGIILLAVVVGLIRAGGGSVDWNSIGRIALKAVLFWLGSTLLGIFLAPKFTRGLKSLRDMDTLTIISFGLALFLAGLSELAGLAMIIGAYVMGLALSQTDVAEDIHRRMGGLYNFISPIFFCVMGMLVNFSVLPSVLVFGIVYSVLGMVGKILGCGMPAFFSGFNMKGSLRIGLGMLPRGEVTLIMASIGLSAGVLDSGIFGVAVMSMLIPSIVAPFFLARSFAGDSGYKKVTEKASHGNLVSVILSFPSDSLAAFVVQRLLDAFRRADFFPRRVGNEKPVYALRRDRIQITLAREGSRIVATGPPNQESFVRLLLTEELLALKDLFKNVEQVAGSIAMEREVLDKLFDGSENDN